jgi:hypothetical protein
VGPSWTWRRCRTLFHTITRTSRFSCAAGPDPAWGLGSEAGVGIVDEVDLLRDAYQQAQATTSVEEYLATFSPEALAAGDTISKYVAKRCDVD